MLEWPSVIDPSSASSVSVIHISISVHFPQRSNTPFHKLTLAAIAAALATCLFTSAASAAPTPEVEPNDNIFQMTGPIGIDGAAGSISTASDVDLFLVMLRPQRQVRLNYDVAPGGSCDTVDFDFATLAGDNINGNSYVSGHEEALITTPGVFGGASIAALLTVSERWDPGCTYKFSITNTTGGPTDAIDTSPQPNYPVVPTAEPNDLRTQAVGPLGGDIFYTGQIDTSSDVDWVSTDVLSNQTAYVELGASGSSVDAKVYRSGSDSYNTSFSAYSNQISVGTFTTGSASRYLIELTGSTGAKWRLRLTPSTAFGPPPPPKASSAVYARKVRRGKSVRIYVYDSSATRLTFWWIRKNKVRRSGTRAIKNGRALVSTKKLRRGKYTLRYKVPGLGRRNVSIRIN